jgi:hypothetical protein
VPAEYDEIHLNLRLYITIRMTTKKPSALTELLSGASPGLAELAAEARHLEALRRRVIRLLPAETAPHCLGAALDENGVLTLFLDSAVWTTALRYQHVALLAAAQQELGRACRTLQLKVLPEPIPGVPTKPPPHHLSAETRRLLASTAASLDDAPLAAALKRLAAEKPSK